MSLILGSLLVVAAVLVLRLGARAAVGKGRRRWSDRLVEWVVAPGVTAAFGLGAALMLEYALSPSGSGSEWLPLTVAGLAFVGLVIGWRRIGPIPVREAAADLTAASVGTVAEAEGRSRAA